MLEKDFKVNKQSIWYETIGKRQDKKSNLWRQPHPLYLFSVLQVNAFTEKDLTQDTTDFPVLSEWRSETTTNS